MIYESKFLVALGITLAIEVPIVWGFVRKWRAVVVGFLASALTLPYLWFVLAPYVDARYFLWIGELSVIVVEAVIYFVLLRVKWWVAVMASVLANVLSYFFGVELFKWIF